jgi:ATP-dependent Clp protease ATP-binding subunit ClpC
MLDDIAARLLKQHGITLEVSEEAEELLLKSGFSATFGARELSRMVERMLEMPLSRMVLSGEATAGKTWRVETKDQGLTIAAGR